MEVEASSQLHPVPASETYSICDDTIMFKSSTLAPHTTCPKAGTDPERPSAVRGEQSTGKQWLSLPHVVVAAFLMLLTLTLSGSSAVAQAAVAQAAAALPGVVESKADDGDGIKVRDARRNVLFGNPKRTKNPSVVDYKKALGATPEARKIRADGIDKNSAQYAILKQKAVKRLKKVIQSVAIAEGRDCVVKKGSIRSKGSADVVDITSQVVSELESANLD